MILAFFPCTRFETKIIMRMRGDSFGCDKWSDERKLEYSMKLHKEMDEMYGLLSKMVIVCKRKDLKLIIENPKSSPHHLTDYWCLKPSIIDRDRTWNGDYYKKPTQYWFVNCVPKNNLVFEPIEYIETRRIDYLTGGNVKTQRSMIHPQYASRFIRQYLIDEPTLRKEQ